jgi:hypothetical protein
MLGVEGGHVRAEGKADQRTADAAERVQQVSAMRAEAAPHHAGDDADPGGDDRREADVGLVDEVREGAAVDRRGRAEEAVHEQRREHVAGERGEDNDPRARERQRHEADDREAEQRGKPWTVGDDAARQQ